MAEPEHGRRRRSLARLEAVAPRDSAIIGREAELDELAALLADHRSRLLVLTGPGGVGKTRLAYEATRAVAAAGRRVLVVPLAGVLHPTLVLPAIAAASGVSDDLDGATVDALAERLAGDRVLLVLDNFEHVMEARTVVADLLHRADDLTVLVTSRRSLGLGAECEVVVEPLALPARSDGPTAGAIDDAASVRLLIDTARRSDRTFALTRDNAAAVAEICVALDGLPLAIELAAARLRVLAPAELAGLLGRRLDVLRDGCPDRLPHQRTLRATLEWSYRLLGEDERQLLLSCAVFVGGFGVDALAAVTGSDVADVLDPLAGLIDHHLVRPVPSPQRARRFDLLGTVRGYLHDELAVHGLETDARRAHASWAQQLAAEAGAALTGPDAAEALEQLDLEHANLRSALEWLLTDRESDEALRLAAGLWRFWWIRGHLHEGRAWLRRALASYDGAPTAALADGYHGAGELAEAQGDLSEALQHFDAALTIRTRLGLSGAVAESWNAIGLIVRLQGDTARAEELHLAALGGDARRRRPAWAAVSLNNLAANAYASGDLATAATRWAEAVEEIRTVGDRRSLGLLLGNVGVTHLALGDGPAAIAAMRESVAIARELGDATGIAHGLGNLGEALADHGSAEEAAATLADARARTHVLGERAVEAQVLVVTARLAVRTGDAATAARRPRRCARTALR